MDTAGQISFGNSWSHVPFKEVQFTMAESGLWEVRNLFNVILSRFLVFPLTSYGIDFGVEEWTRALEPGDLGLNTSIASS